MFLKWMPLQAASCALAVALFVPFAQKVDPGSPPSPEAPSRQEIAQHSEPGNAPDSSPIATKPGKVNNAPRPDSAPDRHAGRGQLLARTALAFRGVPYRWGGRSPRSGFDCSGLVQAVYGKWGILLPRVARAQYKMGMPVKSDKLLPGDLVFFKNTYRRGLSHVGIYVGDGFFVHAARTGVGVILSRLDSGYHKQHWAGARRLNLSKLPALPDEEKPVERVQLEETQDSAPPDTASSALPR